MRTALLIILCSIVLLAQENENPSESINHYVLENSINDHSYMSRDEWKSITRRRRGLKTGGGLLIGSGSILAPLGGLWILSGWAMGHSEISVIGLTTMGAGTGMIVAGVHMVRKGKALDKEYPFLSRVDIIPTMNISNKTYGTTITINF